MSHHKQYVSWCSLLTLAAAVGCNGSESSGADARGGDGAGGSSVAAAGSAEGGAAGRNTAASGGNAAAGSSGGNAAAGSSAATGGARSGTGGRGGNAGGNSAAGHDGTAGAGAAGQSAVGTDLDGTGKTVPDSDYAIPAGAIFMSPAGDDANVGSQAAPVKTLTRALALVSANGTIVARAGTYRDGSSSSIGKRFTLQSYPHEQVWFDGTDAVTDWQSESGLWYVNWSTPSFCAGKYYDYPYNAQPTANTGPCAHYDMYGDANYPAAADPQMVFVDGVGLHEVVTRAEVTATTFFYDQSAKRLYIGVNPSDLLVEVAARPVAIVLQGGAGGNVLRGVGFRRYATNEYSGNITHGAVCANVPNVTFENDAFAENAAAGAFFANPQGAVVRHSVFARNGFNGLDANGHQSSGGTDNMLVEDSLFQGNNTEHFGKGCSASCAAAGAKFCHMVGMTVKNNIFRDGVGNAKGFWADMACSRGVFVNNLFSGNGDTGLFYEISDTGIIASNLLVDNGGYGLKLGSANTKVYNNTFVNNAQNVLIYDDDRTLGVGGLTDVGPDTRGVEFVNNVLSGGGMVSLWRTSSTSPNTGPSDFFAAFDGNAYYRASGSPATLVEWRDGTTTKYSSSAAFATARGYDKLALDLTTGGEPFFVAPSDGDYRIRAGSAALGSGSALPDEVAAALGVSAGPPSDRGAFSWAH